MLQVVAVDDIVQASEVAFIEQDEIDSLDHLFEEHAEKCAGGGCSCLGFRFQQAAGNLPG